MITAVIYKTSQLLRRIGVPFNETTDKRVVAMRTQILTAGGIQFFVEILPDKSWVASSTNFQGIITGGTAFPNGISEQIKDAVFTYFEIPPYLCNDQLLVADSEHAVNERRVYVQPQFS